MKVLGLIALLWFVGCTEKNDKRLNLQQNAGDALLEEVPNDGQDPDGNKLTHFEAPCAMCHEDVRPPAPHPAGECSSCHTFPDWSQVSVASFSHTPKPETCEGCHARPQEVASRAYPNQGPPANFDPNLPSDGGGHYVGKDCVSCHQTPDEGQAQFTFTHSQPPADFCLPCHYNNGQEEHANDDFAQFEGFGNCFECHQAFDAQNNRNFDPVN